MPEITEPLTDEELRKIAGNGWEPRTMQRLATELLAARARIAELEAERDRAREIACTNSDAADALKAELEADIQTYRDALDDVRGNAGRAQGNAAAMTARVVELQAQVAARDARIAELEAAQRPPLGYVVVENGCDRVAYRGDIYQDRETGEFYAAEDASMRLAELREVQS